MKLYTYLTTLGLAIVAFNPGSARAGSFTDGFDNGTINSFWTVELLSGSSTAIIDNTAPYDGTGSLHLNYGSLQAGISHDFGAAQTGSVSVYMLGENPAGGASAIGIYDNHHNPLGVFQRYAPGSFAARLFDGSPSFDFSAAEAWHQFEMDVDSGGLRFVFDGTTVLTDTNIVSFSSVSMEAWAGGLGNFDLAVINTQAATPEPSAWLLLVSGLPLAIRIRRSRNR